MRRILLFVLKGNYNTLAKEDFTPAIGALRVMMHQMKNHLTMCSKLNHLPLEKEKYL